MVVLTETMVKGRTRIDRLEWIKNLNLWGQDIHDATLISKLPNLEVVSLSLNKISDLEPFAHCSELRELYLRQNAVASLDELKFLMGLPNLQVLWLADNPCAEVPGYRATVIRNLPGLEKLDDVLVTPKERAAAELTAPLLVPRSCGAFRASVGSGWGAEDSLGRPSATVCVPRQSPRQSSCHSSEVYGADDILARISRAEDSPGVCGTSAGQPSDCGSNVFFAVMALLQELSKEELAAVTCEAHQLLHGCNRY